MSAPFLMSSTSVEMNRSECMVTSRYRKARLASLGCWEVVLTAFAVGHVHSALPPSPHASLIMTVCQWAFIRVYTLTVTPGSLLALLAAVVRLVEALLNWLADREVLEAQRRAQRGPGLAPGARALPKPTKRDQPEG
jgi:hypothetical protein